MSADETQFLLLDMLIAARAAVERTANLTWEQFLRDTSLQDAVMRPIQIVGEAAFQMPVEFRESHPEVPWQDIIGMRHRLVHGYRQIAREIGDTARISLPTLIAVLEPLVPPPEKDD